ncbi:MAG: hypothetical protein DYG84_14500, partial [Candidatus Brocadia sp. AMX3]|nr:hypothetical protein [Candidatus Brocadia sp. AMX3]
QKVIAYSRLFNLLGRTLLFHITIARVLSEAISRFHNRELVAAAPRYAVSPLPGKSWQQPAALLW